MKIWLVNNYNMLPEHGGLNRNYHFGIYLKKMGHEPIAFVGSHPHNSDLQLIDGKEKFKIYKKEPFPWVLIKTNKYCDNTKKRIVSMFEYYVNLMRATKNFDKPDAVIGSSAHPLAALAAIRLGKKYNCKKIVEIRDLWPESIVEYGISGKRSIIVKILRKFELYLYKKADAIIFTQEGAYKYIEEQGWEKYVPKSKVFYINNGVNREMFNYNRDNFTISDDDLDNDSIYKVVYAGSVRKVNNLSLLLDIAKKVKNPKIKFLIWGKGEELEKLKRIVEEEKINNVVFKGFVEKKYIPYVLSKADLNYAHNNPTPLFRFGISFNKIFDYCASGKPTLCDFPAEFNPILMTGAGVSVDSSDPVEVAKEIDRFSYMNKEQYGEYCKAAEKAAEKYDFENLTKELVEVINTIK